jgi:type I restriction enzyme S subunit
MTLDTKQLGEIIQPAAVARAGDAQYPILSMTMHHGLVEQSDKFKKRIASVDTSPYRVVKRGQLVVGFPIDEAVLSIQNLHDLAIVSPAYEIWDVLDTSGVYEAYLERYLRSPFAISYYSAKLQGTTARRRSLPKDVFLEMPVPVPSYSEQLRITEVLQQADALRRKRRTALALLDELSRSLFIDMFGDPGTNPSQWPIVTVQELIESAAYGTSSKAGESGDIPVLRMNNITPTGEVNLRDLKYMSQSDAPEKYMVRRGDILFNRTNSPELVGKTAVYRGDEPLAYAGYLIRVRVNGSNDSEYLAAYLNTRYAKAVLRGMCKQIIGMANINARELQQIKIPKPPLELQRSFARRLQSLQSVKATHLLQMESLDTLFLSLQHRGFRGKL